jgi:hypothetical protein
MIEAAFADPALPPTVGSAPQPASALLFDAEVGAGRLRLCLAGSARHAVDAALALDDCEELLAALDTWCGSPLDWRWQPVCAAPPTDAQIALRWRGGFVRLLCSWQWLRALTPPPAALAERLHWPPVPVVVCAGLLRASAAELQQLEPGGAVVVPAAMSTPWAGALRGVDEAPQAGIALQIDKPAAPRLMPRRAAPAAAGNGDVLCEVRLAAAPVLMGEHLAGWREGALDLREFDQRASLWRCAGAGAPAQRLAAGRLLPWGDGHVLLLETVEPPAQTV